MMERRMMERKKKDKKDGKKMDRWEKEYGVKKINKKYSVLLICYN